jgi:hypothetical protein
MKKERFSIDINASKEKIWQILWSDDSYRHWTSVFNAGSYAVSDWKEGSKIQFLSSDGSGMFSVIEKNTPNEFMSFRHMGIIQDGQEQHIDQENEDWSGATENYSLRETNGKTNLSVEMDVTDDFQQFFRETFPKALEKVKELAESQDGLGEII